MLLKRGWNVDGLSAPRATAHDMKLHRRTLGETDRFGLSYMIRFAVVAGLYIAAAKAGLALSVAHGSATPVWAPTGIALAALLIFGMDMWPAIAVGAFIANATSPIPIGAAAGIAVGNTAEAVIGYLLLRAVGFRTSLERVRDVIALVTLAAIASTTISATVGVTTSLIAGTVTGATFWAHWAIWWIGDMMGDLLIAPLLLVWIGGWRTRPKGHPLEGLAVAVLLGAGSAFVFSGDRWVYAYVLFPLILWATLRFAEHGATLAAATVAIVGLARLLGGEQPAGLTNLTAAVEAYQALIGIVGISLLVLAATTSERARAEATLEERARLQEQTRKALEREREAVCRLKELDELKTTFLHAVSHDLRTPLTSILGLASTLERQDLDFPREEARELAHRIVRNSRRLHRLVSDLLDFERLERGMLGADRVSTDVGALVHSVARDVELRDHPLHVDADPVTAAVDAPKVERIVDNLLANAIKHTPPGTDIWLSLSADDDGVILTLEDSGAGVPEAEREAIFAPFARASESSSPGTGIGLALVAKFAELHGGRAWVTDREGGGAAFHVTLPADKSPCAEVKEPEIEVLPGEIGRDRIEIA
jgi:signal transduction histidine kinase